MDIQYLANSKHSKMSMFRAASFDISIGMRYSHRFSYASVDTERVEFLPVLYSALMSYVPSMVTRTQGDVFHW